jgi:hypothetical protein
LLRRQGERQPVRPAVDQAGCGGGTLPPFRNIGCYLRACVAGLGRADAGGESLLAGLVPRCQGRCGTAGPRRSGSRRQPGSRVGAACAAPRGPILRGTRTRRQDCRSDDGGNPNVHATFLADRPVRANGNPPGRVAGSTQSRAAQPWAALQTGQPRACAVSSRFARQGGGACREGATGLSVGTTMTVQEMPASQRRGARAFAGRLRRLFVLHQTSSRG